MDDYSVPDPERQKLAAKYEIISRRLTMIEWLITAVLLFLFLFGGIWIKIDTFLSFPQPWASAVYFVILALIFGLITMPLSYYGGFILPHRYGLSTQGLKQWIGDRAKAGALSMVLGLVVVIFVYWVLSSFAGIWWVWSGIFIIVISLLLTRLSSTLLLSLFFKLEPLANAELEKRLKDLAEHARSKVSGIYTIDLSAKGTTANAMLAGMGSTRRIILTDTLLQKYSPDEIEVILGHELAHHLHRDIPKLIIVQMVIAFAGFYLVDLALRFGMMPLGFQSIGDVTGLPFIIIVLAAFNLLLTPYLNSYSRLLESAADKTAIELTDNPGAFISAMTKLTDQNLSVAQPRRWIEVLFYDHPPYFRRVKLARDYIETKTGGKLSN